MGLRHAVTPRRANAILHNPQPFLAMADGGEQSYEAAMRPGVRRSARDQAVGSAGPCWRWGTRRQ